MPTPEVAAPIPDYDKATLGQIFTPPSIVDCMLKLVRNTGRVLEPACGDGAFLRHFPGALGIEIDARHAPAGAEVMNFFELAEDELFSTIIGNPPYVRFQDISPGTRRLAGDSVLDKRANLYLFFIEKCLRLLEPGGELIFITPRDLLKGPVPVLLFPLVAVRSAVQGLFQTMITCVHRIEGRALGAECAFSDGKIRVALGGDELAAFHIGDDLTLY